MDTTGTLFFFSASLDGETAELSFVSRLINKPEALRSAAHGTDLYREMMAHFGPENIEQIQGKWVQGTNFDRYWDEIESGASQTEAVFRTWSGRMAKEFGFSKIKSIVHKKSQSRRPPVLVQFIRP